MGKAVRVIAGIIVVLIIAAGVALGFNPFGSNRPEGVDSDSSEVRIMSRNKDVLWVTPETAESLGVE